MKKRLALPQLISFSIGCPIYDEKGALLNYPRVLCIGTHGDKLKAMGKKYNQKIQEIESYCKGKPFEILIDGFHIVDNTTAGRRIDEDVDFSKVRNTIRDFTYNKLIVKTPISWVLFRKVIQALKANVISLEEAHAIGIACKIPSDVVPKVLLFYHDLGVLLFYPHITGLENEVKTDQYYDPSVKQYFLPLVLPLVKEASVSLQYLQRATPMHLTFRTEFVPPGFFTRFITTIAESPLCEINFDKGVHRNQIKIEFGDPPIDEVILSEQPCAIQVDVFRCAPESESLDKFTHVCQELCSFVKEVAKDIDKCLFAGEGIDYDIDDNDESGKVFKEVRFVCAAPECQSTSGYHYLKHKKGQTCDLYLRCENNDMHRKVLPEEGFWFPDKSTALKVNTTCVYVNCIIFL